MGINKKTSQETQLALAAIDGSEIVRISKQVSGVWQNYYCVFDDLKSWIGGDLATVLALGNDGGGLDIENVNTLLDAGGIDSINLFNRLLIDSVNNVAVDYSDRYLYDPFATTSIGWSDRLMFDSSGNYSIDWDHHTLSDSWAINNDLSVAGNLVVGGSIGVVGNVTLTGAVNMQALQPFADDTAAGTAGLVTGDLFQTDGSGSSPLNAPGIVMVKQ